MKLSFRKSGGFAPVFQGCSFDTEKEPGPESIELEKLVKASNIISLESKRVPQARDVFYYTFEIEQGQKSHSVTFDQLCVPEEVQPLLEFLLARSRNMLPD